MKPVEEILEVEYININGVFMDIDDTVTTDGLLTAEAYMSLERLHKAGFMVVPITGRPAGWCDHIARMWPVDAVVGENGAFYFRYDRKKNKMIKRFFNDPGVRLENREKLERLRQKILKAVPGCAVASDQSYREADLAIDFREDVLPLPKQKVEEIVHLFQQDGANAKVSSIHVNGWFGEYDKLCMTRILMAEEFDIDLKSSRSGFVFVGDSPNDAPMFQFFPYSIGVANVANFREELSSTHAPTYITRHECGTGFVEVADLLIRLRTTSGNQFGM